MRTGFPKWSKGDSTPSGVVRGRVNTTAVIEPATELTTNGLRGQRLRRGQDPAHCRVVNLVVTADGARWYTGLALRQDRRDEPRILRRDTLSHESFRDRLPTLDVGGVGRTGSGTGGVGSAI